MKLIDILLASIMLLLIILAIYFVYQAKQEGSQCIGDPLRYAVNPLAFLDQIKTLQLVVL